MARRAKGQTVGVPAGRKVERKFALSPEAAGRLDVHAVATGRKPSALVEELVLTHLRRYHLVDRGGSGLPSAGEGCGRGETPAA